MENPTLLRSTDLGFSSWTFAALIQRRILTVERGSNIQLKCRNLGALGFGGSFVPGFAKPPDRRTRAGVHRQNGELMEHVAGAPRTPKSALSPHPNYPALQP